MKEKVSETTTKTRIYPGTLCCRCGVNKGDGGKCEPQGYLGKTFDYHFYNKKSMLLTETLIKYLEK